MRPDVLFTNAYHISNDHHEQITMRPYPALGPLYIAAYLRQHGYTVSFFDSVFQTDEDALLETVRRQDPRFVGISALVIGCSTAGEQIRRMKEQGRTVIVGGPDPSIVPGTYLKEYGADYVVIGEGEHTALELMDTLSGRSARPIEEVHGIAYLRDGDLQYTRAREKIKDLDSLPWPARDLMDFAPSQAAWRTRHGYSSVHLLTSRSCPFRCNWCSKGVYGKTFRARDPQDVAKEMRWLIDTYQPERLWVADDLIGVHKKWVSQWHDAVLAATIQYVQARLRPARRTGFDRKVPVDLAKVAYYRLAAGRARRDKVGTARPLAGPGFSHTGS